MESSHGRDGAGADWVVLGIEDEVPTDVHVILADNVVTLYEAVCSRLAPRDHKEVPGDAASSG